MKLKLAVIVMFSCISSLASNEALWIALASVGKEKEAKVILEREYDKIDPNFAPSGYPGHTIFWAAAAGLQFSVVMRLLSKPRLDLNASPQTGSEAGKTAFWYAAWAKRYNVMEIMLSRFPWLDPLAAPRIGQFAGIDALDIVEHDLFDAQTFRDADRVRQLSAIQQQLFARLGYGHPRALAGSLGQLVRRMLTLDPNQSVMQAFLNARQYRAIHAQLQAVAAMRARLGAS